MAARITNEVLDSYVCCKYKGYLKLIGQRGDPSDYEARLATARQTVVRLKAIDKIQARNQEGHVVHNPILNTATLARESDVILDALLDDDLLSLSIDGLKKVPGVSQLGRFLYLPMLFYEGARVRKEQRLLLDVCAVLLSRYQGIVPSRGILWHGHDCTPTTIRLTPDPRSAKRILADLTKMCSAPEPPPLILNDHCQICEFRQRCHDQAVQEDNLSLLRGLSPKEIRAYNRKGILTVTQLAHMFRPRRQGKRAQPGTKRRYHALQALALRDKRIYVLGTPELPTSRVRIYLDVESDPEAGFVYLIGLLVVENGIARSHSFWADTKEQEATIFAQFVAEVTRHDDVRVFCYGSYERAFLTRLRKRTARPDQVDTILDRLVNVLSVIYAYVYFPTYSNSLKEIGRCLGCAWTEPTASGLQSIVWRQQWEETHSETWKQTLQTYNLEDCCALKRVTDLLQAISTQTTSEDVSPRADTTRPPISLVWDMANPTDLRFQWRRVAFVHPEYEHINTAAYFDYQRERVYVRTSKSLRKTRPPKTMATANRKLKVSRHLVIVATFCPVCHSTDVINGLKKQIKGQGPRIKKAFDLVLTPTGIRRVVIESRTSVHRCVTCGAEFVPEQHRRLDRHFHGLKSWAMFQHVEYRIGLKTLTMMCEELFGIDICFSEMHMFKLLMASYYQPTYQALLDKILSGGLLHVDETEVKLQKGKKGYVWVFTNLEEVAYMVRPTREGDFLRELLIGFRGVLVSDFYSAYDGIQCAQQKCLIHLMRDINQDLLDNPFDEDLKSITQPFGALLRRIVATVDEHGLRRHYLRQHNADVTRFFRSLGEQAYSSDAAEALRERLTKYRNKLFTFLDYDGVPWNNNNAEYAIKQFAYYREKTNGGVTEPRLHDYLVLLSLCQTCKYRGVSFLKFMLSKELDVDAFCQRKQRRRPPFSIELYPEGFVPPHLAWGYKTRASRERHTDEILGEDETDEPIEQ